MDFKQYTWSLSSLKTYDNESVEVTIYSNLYRAVDIKKPGNVSITVSTYIDNWP